MLIQILLIFFAVFALTRALRQFRVGSLSRGWLAFWGLFWTGLVVVVLLPQTTQTLARFAGVGRGADLALYVSLIVLFYVVFRLFVKMEEVERQITLLVRKEALKEVEPKEYIE